MEDSDRTAYPFFFTIRLFGLCALCGEKANLPALGHRLGEFLHHLFET